MGVLELLFIDNNQWLSQIATIEAMWKLNWILQSDFLNKGEGEKFIIKSVNVLWTPVKSCVIEIKVCTKGMKDSAVYFELLYLYIF